jgi:hypothetical protein
MLCAQDDAVLVIVNVGTILQIVRLAPQLQGDNAVILAGGVI